MTANFLLEVRISAGHDLSRFVEMKAWMRGKSTDSELRERNDSGKPFNNSFNDSITRLTIMTLPDNPCDSFIFVLRCLATTTCEGHCPHQFYFFPISVSS